MKYDDKIYFTDDIIKAYTNRRKSIKKEEVKDLLDCVLGYLKEEIKYDKEYAYEIPTLGILHLPFDAVDETISTLSKNTVRYDKMMFEIMFDKKSPILRPTKYKKEDLEDLQNKQNNDQP